MGRVTATDPDRDTLSYSITAGDEDGKFDINDGNGEIKVAGDHTGLLRGLANLHRLELDRNELRGAYPPHWDSFPPCTTSTCSETGSRDRYRRKPLKGSIPTELGT